MLFTVICDTLLSKYFMNTFLDNMNNSKVLIDASLNPVPAHIMTLLFHDVQTRQSAVVKIDGSRQRALIPDVDLSQGPASFSLGKYLRVHRKWGE